MLNPYMQISAESGFVGQKRMPDISATQKPNAPNPVDPEKCGGCKHWTVDYFPHGNYEFEFWNCEHKNHYGKRLVRCNRINRLRPVACRKEWEK